MSDNDIFWSEIGSGFGAGRHTSSFSQLLLLLLRGIIPRQETLKPQLQNNNNSNRTPFVISYNPALPNVSTTVRKNINILQSSNRCKQIFPSPPIVAYKRSPNLFVTYLSEALYVIVAYNKKNHLTAFQNAIIHAALPVHF